jgi:hypothetical protein
VTDDEFAWLTENDLGICSHTQDGAIRVLRACLEIGELNAEEGTDWIGELELRAELPLLDSRDAVLCWVNSAGLIYHSEDGDAGQVVLSERGEEALAFLRAADEEEDELMRKAAN